MLPSWRSGVTPHAKSHTIGGPPGLVPARAVPTLGSANQFDLKLVIEPVTTGEFHYFTIVTGIFAPIVRGTLICRVDRTDGSVPTPSAAEKRPRFETLSLPKTAKFSDNGS